MSGELFEPFAPRPRQITSLEELRQRVDAVLAVDIPDDPRDERAFFYHTRDWCLGYWAAHLDLRHQLEGEAK